MYSDGSEYCFGCGFVQRSHTSVWAVQDEAEGLSDASTRINLPEDTCTTFGAGATNYLVKSGVGVQQAIERGLRYSPTSEQLLFPYYDKEGTLACLQARNFNQYRSQKAKYHNQGSPADVLPIYTCLDVVGTRGLTKTLTITEDALSAIRIASQCDAMPALGTYVPVQKLIALRPLYEFLIVWLDRDKFREANTIADNYKWLGRSARVIYSELDPKAYTDEQITAYLTK